jgi:phenylalanyl-tRNA synthetase beta chain
VTGAGGAATAVGGSGIEVGRIFRVHPACEARLELKGDTIAFDLDFDALHDAAPRAVSYRPPARYPSVPFDVAVVAPERVPVRDIMAVIRTAAGDLFRSADVFDVFRGAVAGEGKKSVAFHVVFGADDRTLRGEEVTGVQDRVVAALRDAGFPLRA